MASANCAYSKGFKRIYDRFGRQREAVDILPSVFQKPSVSQNTECVQKTFSDSDLQNLLLFSCCRKDKIGKENIEKKIEANSKKKFRNDSNYTDKFNLTSSSSSSSSSSFLCSFLTHSIFCRKLTVYRIFENCRLKTVEISNHKKKKKNRIKYS